MSAVNRKKAIGVALLGMAGVTKGLSTPRNGTTNTVQMSPSSVPTASVDWSNIAPTGAVSTADVSNDHESLQKRQQGYTPSNDPTILMGQLADKDSVMKDILAQLKNSTNTQDYKAVNQTLITNLLSQFQTHLENQDANLGKVNETVVGLDKNVQSNAEATKNDRTGTGASIGITALSYIASVAASKIEEPQKRKVVGAGVGLGSALLLGIVGGVVPSDKTTKLTLGIGAPVSAGIEAAMDHLVPMGK